VDNASTDDTPGEVERLQQVGGHSIRYAYEANPGLSFARNAGAQATRGDILVYIDDDALATPVWLENLAKGFELAPDVAAVGGGIELQWEGERPGWLPPELEGYLGHTARLGGGLRILNQGMYPFGGNFAVSRSSFDEIGGFSVHLGAGSKTTGYGEEEEFCQRLWRAGGQIAYAPEALVYHRIFPHRMTRRYMLRRGYGQGKSDVIVAQLQGRSPRWKLFLAAGVDTMRLFRDVLDAAYKRAVGRNQDAFAQLVYTASRWGRVEQEVRLAVTGWEGG
jgi:glycosyltransferase involved in cell wall biosynthesis